MKNKYVCGWCQYEFEQDVNYSTGKSGKVSKAGMGIAARHKGTGSDQVKCPKCANLIPTWKKVMLEDVGHIHPGR